MCSWYAATLLSEQFVAMDCSARLTTAARVSAARAHTSFAASAARKGRAGRVSGRSARSGYSSSGQGVRSGRGQRGWQKRDRHLLPACSSHRVGF